MSKIKYKVLLIEPSIIIKEGLMTILQRINHAIEIAHCFSLEEYLDQPNTRNDVYDMIILNPSDTSRDLLFKSRFLHQFKNTVVIGMITFVGTKNFINQLNDVIYINESQDQIKDIITKYIVKRGTEKIIVNLPLTDREIDVLKLLVKGMTSKEIAEKLFISTHTVITHRKNITAKLGIKTTSALAIYAVSTNLVDIDEVLR